jgi:PAS domain-containing protein
VLVYLLLAIAIAQRVECMSASPPSRDVGLEQRQKSRSRMKLALEAAHVGTWEWEIGSDRTFWSPENYTLMGLPQGTGLATYDAWLARVHPEDRERAQAEVARAVETDPDVAEIVHKPFSLEELSRKVRSVLDRAGPAR